MAVSNKRERERERERERDESCYVSPRQERFLIHVHKAYFQEIWRGDSFVLVSVSSGKPSGMNNELLHLTKKSFIFSSRFVVNAEKKIMRCVSVMLLGKYLVLAAAYLGQLKKEWCGLSKAPHWQEGSATIFFLKRWELSELHSIRILECSSWPLR